MIVFHFQKAIKLTSGHILFITERNISDFLTYNIIAIIETKPVSQKCYINFKVELYLNTNC